MPDALQRLGEGADLVQLDEDRVGAPLLDAAVEALHVGAEQVVADELHTGRDRFRELRPPSPVVLRQAVLDRDDRIAVDPALVQRYHLVRRLLFPPALLEDVRAVLIQLGRRRIQGDRHVLPRLVAGAPDRGQDRLERGLVAGQVGREPAFVPDGGREVSLLQHLLERMEYLDADAEAVGEAVRADRHDHELLEVHVVSGMGAAVQDVHHRHGEDVHHRTAEVAIQRQPRILGRGARHGEGDGEDGVRSQVALVRGAVEIEHRVVDRDLVFPGHALEPRADRLVDMLHGLEDALAREALLVPVAQLHGLVLPGGRPTRDGRPAGRAARQGDVGLDRRVAPAVEDFARVNGNDRAHGRLP